MASHHTGKDRGERDRKYAIKGGVRERVQYTRMNDREWRALDVVARSMEMTRSDVVRVLVCREALVCRTCREWDRVLP
jgi:hypothetical protein